MSFFCLDSIEDLAFKKMPEVGPAPDMINDDLPTNMDYLDESFGAAAGLRELRDDDLDEFKSEDVRYGRASPVATLDGIGIVSRIGGETIKILRPEGIQMKEGYFETLPPDAGSATTT
jgi:autophagy-related protein 2